MRIYYVGDLPDHRDERLAGVVLSHGQPVDVHDKKLVTELLKLPWFSTEVIPAVAMADHSSTLFEETSYVTADLREGEERDVPDDVPMIDEEADEEEAL